MAVASFSGGNAALITARAAGIIMAPKTPWRTRAPMSSSMVFDIAHSTEATVKPTRPINSPFLRPIRSTRVPAGISRPASTSR
ncbi:hypothetical protein STENM223S_11714 [Streptomyces tendae]